MSLSESENIAISIGDVSHFRILIDSILNTQIFVEETPVISLWTYLADSH